MKENLSQYKNTRVQYFQKGENPVWLIYSGTHGNEAGVIQSIENFLIKNEEKFPDFLWVPRVSPSAVALKTREDDHGLDTNRIFFDSSENEEVRANLQIVHEKKFEYFLDFHEDPTTKSFYLYDSLGVCDEMMKELLQKQKNSGIPLWHGIDDEEDPKLGFFVDSGYCDASRITNNSGFTGDYLITKGIIQKRAWTFEIPGLDSEDQKNIVVKNIFETCLKFLNV
jgi:hypothetical protein